MIIYKTRAQAELIRESCKIVNDAIAEAAKMLKPGITTMQLDRRIEEYIKDCGALPSFKGYSGYPYASCISVNDAVVHGFPNEEVLKEGDVVSVDVGAFKNNFHGDSAYTFILGSTADEKVARLVRTTKESLYLGIEKAVAGNRIGDISHAIQQHTERLFGYGVVRELVGHGLGNDLHEDPQVPNYGKRGSGTILKEGLVIAIEPMINLGRKDVTTASDGWTILTRDGKPSAHFENTVFVQRDKADILSSFDTIEKAEKENSSLFSAYM